MDRGMLPVKSTCCAMRGRRIWRSLRQRGWRRGRQDEGGSADPGRGAGIHPERVEGRISDRSGVVSAISAGGSGSGERDDFDWHDATAAGRDLDAAEDSAVCDGGWMESAGGSVD